MSRSGGKYAASGKLLPAVKHVQMRYTQEDFRPTATTIGNFRQYTWNLNNIFDPDFTGGGQQPQGHDEWANFYDHYHVDRCKVVVTAYNLDDTYPSWVSMRPYSLTLEEDDVTFEAGNVQAFKLEKHRSWHSVPRKSVRTFVRWFKPRKYSGGSLENSLATNSALMTASPLDKIRLHVGMWSEPTQVPNVYIGVTLTYFVRLFDPKDLGIS